MRLSVESNLQELIDYWETSPEITREELTRSVWEAELLFERHAKEGTPRGVGAGGGLEGSIAAFQPVALDNGVSGIVGTSIAHAVPIELGTRPHFPPIRPLTDWVEKKLGLEGKEAVSVAFAIARTIAVKGTKARKMFQKAFIQTESQIENILIDSAKRIAERLNGL